MRKRGRRYTSPKSVRLGLASIVNGLEMGTLDAKKAAVMVQALTSLLAIMNKEEDEKREQNKQRVSPPLENRNGSGRTAADA